MTSGLGTTTCKPRGVSLKRVVAPSATGHISIPIATSENIYSGRVFD